MLSLSQATSCCYNLTISVVKRHLLPLNHFLPKCQTLSWKYRITQIEWELLKCVVADMYSWQHCGTGTLSYRQPCHAVIMEQLKGQQRAFVIKIKKYIISITSLASNFSMIGLNRLIHDLTQALPNMKLKKDSCQYPHRGCITTNLRQGKVYQSSRRKGVGGVEATLTKYLGKSRKPKTRHRGCITTD